MESLGKVFGEITASIRERTKNPLPDWALCECGKLRMDVPGVREMAIERVGHADVPACLCDTEKAEAIRARFELSNIPHQSADDFPRQFHNFTPREGTDKAFIAAKAFTESPNPVILTLMGRTGCLRGDTRIFDPIDKSRLTVEERYRLGLPFHVYALDGARKVVAAASPPARYRTTPMVRITTSESSVVVTHEHRFLSAQWEWVTAREVCGVLSRGVAFRLLSSVAGDHEGQSPDALCLTRTGGGSLVDCPLYHRSSDARLQSVTRTALAPSPSPTGVQGHASCASLVSLGAREHRSLCSHPSPLELHLSRQGCSDHFGGGWELSLPTREQLSHAARSIAPSCISASCSIPDSTTTRPSSAARQSTLVSLHYSYAHSTQVVSAEQTESAPYYDFTVPLYHNYFAEGLWHHNSGKSHLAEAICREYLGRGAQARYESVTTLLDQLRPNSEENASVKSRCALCRVLVLDDLGREKPSEWTAEQLTNIVDERLTRHSKTVVTTNRTREWLAENGYEALASRLFAVATGEAVVVALTRKTDARESGA